MPPVKIEVPSLSGPDTSKGFAFANRVVLFRGGQGPGSKCYWPFNTILLM